MRTIELKLLPHRCCHGSASSRIGAPHQKQRSFRGSLLVNTHLLSTTAAVLEVSGYTDHTTVWTHPQAVNHPRLRHRSSILPFHLDPDQLLSYLLRCLYPSLHQCARLHWVRTPCTLELYLLPLMSSRAPARQICDLRWLRRQRKGSRGRCLASRIDCGRRWMGQ